MNDSLKIYNHICGINASRCYKINYQEDEREINSIIISHNSRIRCWLHNLNSGYFEDILKIHLTDNIRFKNCAILKLELTKEYAKLSLIYEGFINNRKQGKYYTNNHNDIFDDVLFESININLKSFGLDKEDIKYNYNFYILRHGEATHNINKNLKQIDPELTVNGITQSTKAGQFFSRVLNTGLITYFFVSKLKRTRQTLSNILNQLNLPISNVKIIVLPCTHEIKYYPGGKCVSRNKQSNSDIMICDINNLKCDNKDMCCNINQYKIIWDYYLDFYLNNNQCSDFNMIKLIFNYFKKITV